MFPTTALPFLSMPPPRTLSEAPAEILLWRRNQRRSHLLPMIVAGVLAIPFAWIAADQRVIFVPVYWTFAMFFIFWPAWVATISLNRRLDRALLKIPLMLAHVTGCKERKVRLRPRYGRSKVQIMLVFQLEVEGRTWELSTVKTESPPVRIGQTYDVLLADRPLAMAVVGQNFWPIRPRGLLASVMGW